MTLLWFAAGFTLADLLGIYLSWAAWVLPAGLICLAAGVFFSLRRRESVLRCLLLGAGVCLVWLTVYGALFHAPAQAMADWTVRMQAVVTDWPQETKYGVRIPAKGGEEDGRKIKVFLYGDETLAKLRPGDHLSCIARCTSTATYHGEESFYQISKGILLSAKIYGDVTVIQQGGLRPSTLPVYLAGAMRGIIDRLYPPDQAAFFHALVTGDKSGLDEETKHNLNRAGISHVVVISGLHVTFLVGFLSLFFKAQRKSTVVILIAVMFSFSAVTGNAPGTLRAAILCTLTLLAPRFHRRTHSLTGLAVALQVLLLWNPYAVADPGLQFSFLSTAGIFCLGQPMVARWKQMLPKRGDRILFPLASVFGISVGAMVFTVPLAALYFQQVSLIAPLTNVLTEWSVSLSFVGGLLSVLLGGIWLPLGQLLAKLVALPAGYFLWVARQSSRWALEAITLNSGYYAAWLVFVCGLAGLYLLWPGREKRPILPVCAGVMTLCLSVLLTAMTVKSADLAVSVLDVGQGQSVAVLSGGCRALIDCGGTLAPGDTAASYLQSLGSSTLDLLVLTHYHEDHAGGVLELMHRVKVKNLALPDIDPDSPLRREITALAAEQGVSVWYIVRNLNVTLGGAKLTLFAPAGGGDENEQCLSILCTAGSWDALVTGDMDSKTEDTLISRERFPDLELLVVGHHGSRYSTGETLLDTLTPETAVISVGYNSYGHPTQDVLDRLSQRDITVYRTDQWGMVTVYANP